MAEIPQARDYRQDNQRPQARPSTPRPGPRPRLVVAPEDRWHRPRHPRPTPGLGWLGWGLTALLLLWLFR